jgi:hypothetical protein
MDIFEQIIFFLEYWFPSFTMIVNDGPKLWHVALENPHGIFMCILKYIYNS